MLARQPAAAEIAGQRAMSIAEEVGADALLAEACILSGISLCMSSDEAGLGRIRRGVALAAQIGDDQLISLAHFQIGSGFGELRRYDVAMPELRQGIEFARERELVSAELYERAWLTRCEFEVGHWEEAARRADELIRNPRCVGNTRLVVLVTLGWLRGRRGDPVGTVLDEALDLGRRSQHVQRLWPVAACRAEAAWLADRLVEEIPVLDEAMALAAEVDYRPAMEELSHWLSIADGRPRGDAATARTPFGASAAGRHDLAAAWWAELGCPYEEAMAWFALGDLEHLQRAYDRFVDMGAEVMRARTGAVLRARGARVPRGAIGSTRQNPFGLTDRELDVLVLLPGGLTNAQIAAKLHISAKTAGHHVSKVLTKLDVGNRAAAAAAAERLGRETHEE
jgi:DNA-binding CsgD family transcriptional regulator